MFNHKPKTITQWVKPVMVVSVVMSTIWASKAGLPNFGNEFAIVPSLPGDQVNSHIALGSNGGFLVWEDNGLDGQGLGIAAVKLNPNMDVEYDVFVVHEGRDGDQQNPQVAINDANDGLFIWESDGDIFGRLLGHKGYFLGEEFIVNDYTRHTQRNASVTDLPNGNFVVTWESDEQDGHRKGVFGQIISSNGTKLGDEFGINQNTFQNQRTPDVVSSGDDEFVAVWVSEAPIDGTGSNFAVSVWGRTFNQDGSPKTDEAQLTNTDVLAANPSVAVSPDGKVGLVFSAIDNPALQLPALSGDAPRWDILGVVFEDMSEGPFESVNISNDPESDQAIPELVANGSEFLAVWTGFGGNGDEADVYGVVLDDEFSNLSDPSIQNTSKTSIQYMPTITTDEDGNAVVVWSSYMGGTPSLDLIAQRFSGGNNVIEDALPTPDAPFVYGLGFNELGITWPKIEGFDVEHYEIYVDGQSEPVVTHNHFHVIENLPVGTSHDVEIGFVTTDGARSSLSSVATGSTWEADSNQDGLPDTFQKTFWGHNQAHWEGAFADSDNDGLSNLDELLAGTNPLSARSLLSVGFEKVNGDLWLVWDTTPGGIYQVQGTGDLVDWTNAGGPRFAHSPTDRLAMEGNQAQQIYRVIRLK